MRWAAIEAIQLHPGTAKIVDDKNVAKLAAARKLLTLTNYGLRATGYGKGKIVPWPAAGGGLSTSDAAPPRVAMVCPTPPFGRGPGLIDPGCCTAPLQTADRLPFRRGRARAPFH